MCVCSLSQPACNAHALYSYLRACTAVQYFSTLSHKFSGEGLLNTKCVLIFSKTLFSNISHSKKELSEIWSKMYIGLHVKYRLVLSDFNETWILSTYFRKILKFHWTLSSGSRAVPCGRTDRRTKRHDEADSCYSQYCERVNKKKRPFPATCAVYFEILTSTDSCWHTLTAADIHWQPVIL